MHKTQVQMDQKLQHKANDTEPHRKERGSMLECVGTESHFLNITPVTQILRETINGTS